MKAYKVYGNLLPLPDNNRSGYPLKISVNQLPFITVVMMTPPVVHHH